MKNNSGIFSLLPPVPEDASEIREREKARADVMQRINVQTPALHAAGIDQSTISFKPEFYKSPEPVLSKKEIEDKKFADHIKDAAVNQINKAKMVKQKIKKILPINVDPAHPDGFTFKNDMDTYDQYKDQPIRYMQEIAYKYDRTPVTETVKTYNHMDRDSYPSNPNQQAALRSYGRAFNRLTPLQKKQIATAQKIEKKNKPEKLFESIIDNLGKKK
jgi:hypothetical protein